MTVLSPATWTQYGSYDARNDRLHVSSLLNTEGATNSLSFTVQQQVVPSMVLTVGPGSAYINSSWAAVQGHYGFVNDAPINVTVSPSDPTFPRIDRVVARVYDAYYSGTENKAQIEIVKGNPAVSPAVPDLPASSIEVARVSVAAGATTIVNANINNAVMPLASIRDSLIQNGGSPWIAYTPTLANVTLGNGSITGAYSKIGRTVHYRGAIVFGSTTAVTAQVIVGIPLAAAGGTANNTYGYGHITDASASNLGPMIYARLWTTNSVSLYVGSTGSPVNNGTPITFAVGDTLAFNGTYETTS